MSDTKNEKKEFLKSLGIPVEKLPENKLETFLERMDDNLLEKKDFDFDRLLEEMNMGKHLQNILSTDNNDILSLLKQLEKLRNKDKDR